MRVLVLPIVFGLILGAADLLRRGGISEEAIRQVTYGNALAAYGRNGQMQEADWLDPAPIDQRTLYMGNSVLRGGQTPRVETGKDRADAA